MLEMYKKESGQNDLSSIIPLKISSLTSKPQIQCGIKCLFMCSKGSSHWKWC